MLASIYLSLVLSINYSSDLTQVFESIYETCEWGVDKNFNGTSGSGSEFVNVKPYFYYLSDFLKENNIKSVVDFGCGDWQFSQFIKWDDIKYTGFDASKTIIERNKKNFLKSNISFNHGNFLEIDAPKADLLIIKDVLQHLSNKNINKAIERFKSYNFVIITNDIDPVTFSSLNNDIKDGEYRVLDLTKMPFNIKAEKVLHYKTKNSHEMKQVLLITNG